METCVLQANFCDGTWESFFKGGLYLVLTRRNSGWLNFTPLIALGSLMMGICVLHVNFCDRRCWVLFKGGLYVAMLSKTLERYLSEPEVVEGSGFRHFVGNCVLQITYISDFEKLKV